MAACVNSTGGTATTGSWLYFDMTSTGSSITTSSLFDSSSSTVYVTSYPVQPQQHTTDPRILNRYLNASDLCEEFIRDLGDLGVKQGEILAVPMELFFNWLVVKAAEEDGYAVDDIPKLPERLETYRRDRCRACGRFLPTWKREQGMLYCNGDHFDRAVARLAA